MLRLITTQSPSESGRKLWFNDQDNDLFIWFDRELKPMSFQFCYNKSTDEHSISWHLERGYSHSRIDDGESVEAQYKMTPIMIANGPFNYKETAETFRSISSQLDNKLRDFIYQKILTYHHSSDSK